MGLQTWPPSKPPLSSMACLDVETPSICRGKFKSVLQLCLQQRRTRKQLVEQGIMPPLKTPAAFHEQIRNLERARTGNLLKHKLCSRPDRSELVRMHILQETQAEPSLQATQMKLKRARLADNLNEKIAQRPGPMDLVEKNILHSSSLTDNQKVDSSDHCSTSVFEKSNVCSKKGDKANYPKAPDVYRFDKDNNAALSPEQPASWETPSSTSASPRESGGTEADSTSSQFNSPIQHSPQPNSQFTSDLVNLVSVNEQQGDPQASTPQPVTTNVPSITPGPVLVKQSLPNLPGDKSRSKKSKEPKPRVKKLKYHQYIPPDQKQELNEVPMDSTYARLLHQQQQFLQLQILNQQQYNYHGVLPATLKTAEVQTNCSTVLSEDAAALPVQPSHTQTTCKLDHLPANLDEMKVAELKMELKLRSLPVSGTKTDLIERLKLYQETSNIKTAATMDTTALKTASQSENIKLTPPVSPIVSKVSSLGIKDSNMADSPAKLSDALSPAQAAPCLTSPKRSLQDFPIQGRLYEKDSEKDKRLHEKERQIEELMRKLEQEQKLVEELKMQLEGEKRSQQGESLPQLSSPDPIRVKDEKESPSNCLASSSSGQTGGAVLVKQEEAADQTHVVPPSQFIISHQTIKQPETLQSVQAGAQLLLTASNPGPVVTIQLPPSGIKLHSNVSSLIQTSGEVPQKIEASAALQQQCITHNEPLTRTWRTETTTQSLLNTFPVSGHPAGGSTSQAVLKGPMNKQSKFTNHVSKCKDPPRYEDAVKQTRSMITAVQSSSAASQQMDDLFDVLIESGEIFPFLRQDPPGLDRPLPVTASVTTLPFNTVLSRPPPVVQVAQLPAAPFNPPTILAALTSNTQLGTLLGGTLDVDTEAQSLELMEELHSPLVTMEEDFNENTQPPALTLHSTSMDNLDWLDLSLSVPGEGVNPLDMSAPVGVFSSDFLDSHELHLNWD